MNHFRRHRKYKSRKDNPEFEEQEMSQDPLARLDRSLTKHLEELFSTEADADDGYVTQQNPERKIINQFLSNA